MKKFDRFLYGWWVACTLILVTALLAPRKIDHAYKFTYQVPRIVQINCDIAHWTERRRGQCLAIEVDYTSETWEHICIDLWDRPTWDDGTPLDRDGLCVDSPGFHWDFDAWGSIGQFMRAIPANPDDSPE